MYRVGDHPAFVATSIEQTAEVDYSMGVVRPVPLTMNGQITIRFLSTFLGKENWKLDVPVSVGEDLLTVFKRLDKRLYLELKEKILTPSSPRFAIAINGTRIGKEDLDEITLKGNEEIIVFALLVGG